MRLLALGLLAFGAQCAQRDRPPQGPGPGQPGAPDAPSEPRPDAAESTPPAPAPLDLIDVTDGLGPAHQGVAPLLEKVAYIPAREHGDPPSRVAQRIYPDGAFYMLVSELSGAPVSPRWSMLATLRADGVARLVALFAELCAEPDSLRVDDSGNVNYLVTSPGCTRRFVAGLPSAESRILEADAIINMALRPEP